MSKAKDEYSKQVAMISFTSHYSTGPIVNYVTELEKKAEMFDEMVGALNELTSIIKIHSEATKNTFAWAEVDCAKEILDRAKKNPTEANK